MSIETLIGSAGVSILLAAFALNLVGRLSASSRLYQALNAVGAALACIASAVIWYPPFVVLEFVWFVVALLALLGIARARDTV